MEGQDIHTTEAVIDNGSFGTRTIRFETGRLARQAAGSVAAYLDDETMLLSATTAGKKPKENLDFFPLTVDVEERMYAAGRIPGSFFRREGRPSEDAILTCRLIDRPLRPSFVKGLRNEVQVVITVLALHPKDLYDVIAINAASASTQLAGLPFSGPIGATRVALIDDQWVAFPTHEQLETAVFDMVVAGRVVGDDVAIMMVEAEATDRGLEPDQERGQDRPDRGGRRRRSRGGQAVHPHAVRGAGRARHAGGQADRRSSRGSSTTRTTSRGGREPTVSEDLDQRAGDRRQAGSRERARPHQGLGEGEARQPVRGSREGDQRRVPGRDQEGHPAAHPARQASASTAAACPTSGRCPPRSRCSRAYTARPCSSAARRRSSASRR